MGHLIRTRVTAKNRVRISCVWCGCYSETGIAGRTIGAVAADLRSRFFLERKCGPSRLVTRPLLRLLSWFA